MGFKQLREVAAKKISNLNSSRAEARSE